TIGRKPVVNAALMLHEENMPEAEVLAFLKRSSPSEETLHRRTIARLQDTDYPAYMLTYPLGKEKILNELSHSNNKPETFFEIAKQADYKFHD
ncbi:MAG: hypothetical protein IAF08_09420, partial [Rhizobacter sp.]|nr:hypothetical protein [Chlorobiales bacterium]